MSERVAITNAADAASFAVVRRHPVARHVAGVCTTNCLTKDMHKVGLHQERDIPAPEALFTTGCSCPWWTA